MKELEEIKDFEESKANVKETQPKVITVFGSSRPAEGHGDYAEAVELGRALAEARFAVCTGGYGGVMEGVSRGAHLVFSILENNDHVRGQAANAAIDAIAVAMVEELGPGAVTTEPRK